MTVSNLVIAFVVFGLLAFLIAAGPAALVTALILLLVDNFA